MLPPFYYKDVSEEGLYRYFSEVVQRVGDARLPRRFSIYRGILLIDVGSTQQIIESADPIPPVTIAFKHDAVFAGFVSSAVVLSEKVNQEFALFAINAGIHENFARLFVKIV
jgi:4-hydroxy-tetrahydrodipicolinate synthase